MIFQYFLLTITIRNDYFQRIIIKIVVLCFFFFFIIDANIDVISLFSNFLLKLNEKNYANVCVKVVLWFPWK